MSFFYIYIVLADFILFLLFFGGVGWGVCKMYVFWGMEIFCDISVVVVVFCY